MKRNNKFRYRLLNSFSVGKGILVNLQLLFPNLFSLLSISFYIQMFALLSSVASNSSVTYLYKGRSLESTPIWVGGMWNSKIMPMTLSLCNNKIIV